MSLAAKVLTGLFLGTALGFYAVGSVPRPVALGLLFLNPVFFAILLAAISGRMLALALALGAVLGPLTFTVLPEWSLLISGVVGGTIAFWLGNRRP